MLSICLFWDIINVTYLGHYHNYFIFCIEKQSKKLTNSKKCGTIIKKYGVYGWR